MNSDKKFRYFQMLVKAGYTEIEASYPASSKTELDFTRRLIETPGAVPDDVWLQLMSPCREDLIRATVAAARGAKRVILHIYVATSPCFMRLVFGLTPEQTVAMAVRCAKLVRSLTKDSPDPVVQQTEWTLQFSPETFQDTSLDFAVQICDEVAAVWEPTEHNPIIFNLPATVEMAMPNNFADQIEYFSTHIANRSKVCVSIHTHNDRGCAVASSELSQLAGAQRVEGCLFGNGERTGNVDLVILAMNLYTQGISPGVDLSNLNEIAKLVEESTGISIHPRAPYAGALTFCTFTGPHQDAIKKGYTERKAKVASQGQKDDVSSLPWNVPYLPFDPADLGRVHEAVIRVTAQSGKAGSAWLISKTMGIDLPRALQIAFARTVKSVTDASEREMLSAEAEECFRNEFMRCRDRWMQILEYKVHQHQTHAEAEGNHGFAVGFAALISIGGLTNWWKGQGQHLPSAIADLLKTMGMDVRIREYQTQAISDEGRKFNLSGKQAAIISGSLAQGDAAWGVGIGEDEADATIQAVSRL